MTDLSFPIWQLPYQEAIAEINNAALRDKVLKAEDAICARLSNFMAASIPTPKRKPSKMHSQFYMF